jgi:hypothetical protein
MTQGGSDPSTWFNTPSRPPAPFRDPFLNYGGKDARLRVIPAVRKKLQSNPNGVYINCTTSGRKEGSHLLSPFRLGPCHLYGDITSKNMENAWQYSKVFKPFVGTDGKPTAEYFKWAQLGWSSWKAKRHPTGDGTKSVFHWWDGQRLDKIEARKRIYVPLYVKQVVKERNFQFLKSIWEEDIKPDAESTLYLMDYDAYEYGTMSLSEVLNNPAESMGHGFVLAMLLTNDAALQECELRTS